MGRAIRLKTSDALAAGLLDPAVAEMMRKSGKGIAGGKLSVSKTRGGAGVAAGAVETKQKRKPSKSRPAVHPKISSGPAGSGSIQCLFDGRVCAADFVFDLVPVPKERARVMTNEKTGGTYSYTPARTKHMTTEIQRVIADVFKAKAPIEGPVALEMTFVMGIPESWPAWKRKAALDGHIAPTSRPDMDNLEKALLDAFNGCLIVDDSFVVKREASKVYGAMPGILIKVCQTGQLPLTAKRKAFEARLKVLHDAAEDAR